MKAKWNKKGSTELPRFVVGALAAAGSSVASGATVQISFANNWISTSDTSSFTPDLTGDSRSDIAWVVRPVETWTSMGGSLDDAYGFLLAGAGSFRSVAWAFVGDDVVTSMVPSARVEGLVRMAFADDRINLGAGTFGWLHVEALSDVGGDGTVASVRIRRLIFDDGSTTAPTGVAYTDEAYPEWQVSPVPEPGSNLALLALGAGGLTLRRRLKRPA